MRACSKRDFKSGRCVVQDPSQTTVSLATLVFTLSMTTIVGIITSVFLFQPVHEFFIYTFPTVFDSNFWMFVFGIIFLIIGVMLTIWVRGVVKRGR